jgi:peptidoglycan/LPS O-acetylase OafA/YrhL
VTLTDSVRSAGVILDSRYRPDLDGLRALAVLLVIFYHYRVPGFAGGYVGVDVFFVISGFLITSLIQQEIGEGRFTLLHFYERRIRRIFPALTPLFLVAGIAGYLQLFPEALKRFGESLGAVSLFLSNFEFWRETGYFSEVADQKPLLHTWSLAVEEQFYLLYPPLMIAFAPYRRNWRLNAFLIISALSLVWGIWASFNAPLAGFYLFPSRIWELLIGAVIAIGAFPIVSSRFASTTLAASGLAMLSYAAVLYTPDTPFPGFAALLPCIGAGLIIYAGMGSPPAINKALSVRPVVFIGLISYSLYLWHWPIYVFAKYHLQRDLFPPEIVALIAVSIGIATLSWRYVEMPFRLGYSAPSRRVLFIQAASVTAVLAACGTALYASNGLPQRYTPEMQALLAPEIETHSPSCHKGIEKTSAGPMCTLGRPGQMISFLVWGDSHARALGPAVDAVADRYGSAGLFAPMAACPPLLGVRWPNLRSDSCRHHNDMVLGFLQERTVDTVILAAHWIWYAEGTEYLVANQSAVLFRDGETKELSIEENHRVFARSLQRTIDALHGKVRRIVIVWPVPEVGLAVPTALTFRHLRGLSEEIGPTLTQYEVRNAEVLSDFAGLSSVEFVYPHEILCTALQCAVARDGRPFYFDSEHLSQFGAESISSIFEPVFVNQHRSNREADVHQD